MNQEKNKQLKNKNTGVIVVIIVIVLIFIVGFGLGGYYLYKLGTSSNDEYGELGEDYSYDTEDTGCASCQSDYDDSNVPTSAPSPTSTQSLEGYTNSRYGFEIIPPRDFSSFESENGDGVTYTHSNAVTIRVFGANNSESITLDQYLDKETNEFKTDTGDAKETGINEINLDGCEGERRAWEYSSLVDGTKTIMEKVVCLRDNVFYVMEMIVASSTYSKYSSVFDEVVFSFRFK